MDIRAGIQTAILLASLGAVVLFWSGIQSIRNGRKLLYFRLRQERVANGWRWIGFALLLSGLVFGLVRWGEPVAYTYFPPSATITLSPTPSLSPTISLTPTITFTPSETLTPSISNTPTITFTPFIPAAVETAFSSLVTPNTDAIFSPLIFARDIDANYQPIGPVTVFINPVEKVVAVFSYDKMLNGVQWTALWYREGQLLHYETEIWAGDTGGYGFTSWEPGADTWLAGEYEVQIFVGMEWMVVGRFTVEGDPYTATPSPAPTTTPPPSATLIPSPTRMPSATPQPTLTRVPSRTLTPTSTRVPSKTPLPTDTRWPSSTP
jgi:type VI secretion system secreted protein VgrG